MDGSFRNSKPLVGQISSTEGVNLEDKSQQRKREIMELLHEFNDVKDAAQQVLGALAQMRGVTLKEMHRAYKLPLSE